MVVDQVDAERDFRPLGIHIADEEPLLAFDVLPSLKLRQVHSKPVNESLGIVIEKIPFMSATGWKGTDERAILPLKIFGRFPAAQRVTREPGHLHRKPALVAKLAGKLPDRAVYVNRRFRLQETVDDLGQAGPEGEDRRQYHVAGPARDVAFIIKVLPGISPAGQP